MEKSAKEKFLIAIVALLFISTTFLSHKIGVIWCTVFIYFVYSMFVLWYCDSRDSSDKQVAINRTDKQKVLGIFAPLQILIFVKLGDAININWFLVTVFCLILPQLLWYSYGPKMLEPIHNDRR